MLRLSEIRLQLEHSSSELEDAIKRILQIKSSHILGYRVVKRSIDARSNKRIKFIYSVDVSVLSEQSLLERFVGEKKIKN